MSMSLGNKPVSGRTRTVLVMALAAMVGACGGSGGGGGPIDTTRYASSRDVLVQDAPIIGVIVQDRDGGTGAQTAEAVLQNGVPTGRYQFANLPALPIRITSRNLVAADGTVKIAFTSGQWVSYTDANGNGAFDAGEANQPLSFQDLDGNGIFTQTADIPYTGRFNVDFVPAGTTLVQANVVAGLVPANWNGTSSVGGLSAAVINLALSAGPQASNNVELKKAAALLTAISEALLSNNLAAATNLPSVLSNIAASNVLSSTATPAQLATEVAKALPADKQAVANTLVTNLKTVADNVGTAVTSNFESLIKVAINPDNTNTLKQTNLSSGTLTELTAQVTNASKQITEDQKTASAAGAVDPEVAVIAAMRLVPWHELSRLESGLPLDDTVPFRTIGKTTGFGMVKTPGGALELKASGSPFTDALGAGSTFTIPFVSTGANWQRFPTTNNGVVVDIKSGFQLPGTTTYVPGAMVRVCLANLGGCWPFMLASPTQVCALMNSGTFKTNAVLRADALTKINAINSAQTAVVCP